MRKPFAICFICVHGSILIVDIFKREFIYYNSAYVWNKWPLL